MHSHKPTEYKCPFCRVSGGIEDEFVITRQSDIVFQNDKVFFDISNYGKDSRNVDGLIKKLTEMNIAHTASKVTEWQDVGKIVKTNRTDSLNKEIFGN